MTTYRISPSAPRFAFGFVPVLRWTDIVSSVKNSRIGSSSTTPRATGSTYVDVDPFFAGDLGLYDVAGEERGVVVVGDLAYQRVHVALVGARAGVAVGSLADVLQFDRPLVGVVGEPFELAQSVPARFEPVIGLRLQLADDGLRISTRAAA